MVEQFYITGYGVASILTRKKYESNLIKNSEALYLQSKVNCQMTMKKIEDKWGPYDQDEIDFYFKQLRNDNQ